MRARGALETMTRYENANARAKRSYIKRADARASARAYIYRHIKIRARGSMRRALEKAIAIRARRYKCDIYMLQRHYNRQFIIGSLSAPYASLHFINILIVNFR